MQCRTSPGDADLTRNLDSLWRDELTALNGHFNAFTNKLRAVIGQSKQTASSLDKASQSLGEIATDSQCHSQQQSQQMELVASAIHQVSCAVQEVAKNAAQQNIDSSLHQIDQLSETEVDQQHGIPRRPFAPAAK